jgi:amidase
VISHFGIGFGSDQSIDYTGPMAMTVEDTAAAMQATAGFDGYDPRQPRDLPERIDVMTGLDGGVAGLRVGVLEEGFIDAEPDVADGVMAAVEVLSEAGAEVAKVSVPEHLSIRTAQAALAEGQKAVFDTGFFGAFTRTYYPASLITAVNKMWATEADLMPPRTKLALIAATFAKRNFHGRVYAKAQNVRPTFIRAYDRALADVDLLVMPTVIQKAPRYEAPDGWLAAVEDNLAASSMVLSRNTQPFNYTGHPALALPVGKASGLPVSLQVVGRFHDDALVLRAAYAYQHAVDWDDVIAVGR